MVFAVGLNTFMRQRGDKNANRISVLTIGAFGGETELPNIITTCYNPLRDLNMQGGVAQFESRLVCFSLVITAGGVCAFYM